MQALHAFLTAHPFFALVCFMVLVAFYFVSNVTAYQQMHAATSAPKMQLNRMVRHLGIWMEGGFELPCDTQALFKARGEYAAYTFLIDGLNAQKTLYLPHEGELWALNDTPLPYKLPSFGKWSPYILALGASSNYITLFIDVTPYLKDHNRTQDMLKMDLLALKKQVQILGAQLMAQGDV